MMQALVAVLGAADVRGAVSVLGSELLQRGRLSSLLKVLGYLTLIGGSGTFAVSCLNLAAYRGSAGSSIGLPVLFVILISIQRFYQRSYLRLVSLTTQRFVSKVRERFAAGVVRMRFSDFEALPPAVLTSDLPQQLGIIADDMFFAAISGQAFVTLVFMTAYLTYLSAIAGLMTIALLFLLVVSTAPITQDYFEIAKLSSVANMKVFNILMEVVAGFKELALDPSKRQHVIADLAVASESSSSLAHRRTSLVADLAVAGMSGTYFVGAMAVFVLPLFDHDQHAVLRPVLTLVLFMMAPVARVFGAMQQLTRLRGASARIVAIGRNIETLSQGLETAEPVPFSSLRFKAVGFQHRGGTDAFAIGPIDLTVDRNTVTFITGKNGSGKTTTMRMMTGLYLPTYGELFLNGQPIESASARYRSLFGTVFADFHAFSKPYGLSDRQVERLEELLVEFGIRDKLTLDLRSGYNPIKLSTGQRKRLALAVAIAEGRQILVLDEVAADQDAGFRAFYYRELLGRLTREGRTIIAVTHDEAYLHLADATYEMVDGSLRLAMKPSR